MKKIFSLLLLLSLLITFSSQVLASEVKGTISTDDRNTAGARNANLNLNKNTTGSKIVNANLNVNKGTVGSQMANANLNANYNTLKNGILKTINVALDKIDQLLLKVNSNKWLSDESKKIIVASLNEVRTALVKYQTEVAQTTDWKQLQALNQEIVQYVKDNKDLLKQNVKATLVALAEQAKLSAQKYEALLKQMLQVLKVTCPEQKDAIAEVEKLLDGLDDQLADLAAMDLKSQEPSVLKSLLKDLAQSIQAIAKDLAAIQQACL